MFGESIAYAECLPRHCDEGEQDGDDGFLVHNRLI